MSEPRSNQTAKGIIFSLGAVILLWVTAAFLGALHQLNWNAGEMVYQYMLATGMNRPLHTLVDYYTHIKGIEYLICVAFFAAFPVFVKYINHPKKPVAVTR